MAKRKWSGVLCPEGIQTGDGRFLAPNSIEWSPLPLPFNWMEGSLHTFFQDGAPQIGTIETITREGGNIRATGFIDDEIPGASEFIRRLENGTASHGESAFVSIDPDNWELEIVAKDIDESDASPDEMRARTPLLVDRPKPGTHYTWAAGSPYRLGLTAAAGDGDPADEGAVLFAASVDEVVERYTRLRIRGVTAVDIPAYAEAFISLDGSAEETPAEEPEEPEEPEEEPAPEAKVTVAAGARTLQFPSAWFDDPAFASDPTTDDRLHQNPVTEAWAAPLTITDEGRIFGHVAPWKECHIGIQGTCVVAPHSLTDYAYFMTGAFRADDCDCDIPVGVLTMDTDHLNDLDADYRAATSHYADTGTQAAWIVCGEDDYGIWFSGAVNPELSEDQIRRLRASAASGDWRPVGAGSELVAVLAVNVPGFGIPRARVQIAGGQVRAMVAGAGLVVEQPDPEQVFKESTEARLARLESFMSNLTAVERAQIMSSVDFPNATGGNEDRRIRTVVRH